MLLILLLLLFLFAVGGVALSPFLWLIALVALVAYIVNGPHNPQGRRWW